MNKLSVSVLTEILRCFVSKLTLANALLATMSARGRMRLLLGLVAFVSGGALAAAQAAGCAPNTANYPCVYVANASDGTVSVINAITNNVIANVTVGTFPEGLAVTPNNASVYVANSENGTVSVIDTATSAVVATVPMQNFPLQIAITPDGAFAYVAEFQAARAKKHVPQAGTVLIEVINTTTNQVVGSIQTPNVTAPTAIAITPNGAFAYVADTCPNNSCVEVFSTSNNQLVTTVQLTGSLTFQNAGIAAAPDGAVVYVTDVFNNPPNTESALVAISTSTNQVLSSYATSLNVVLSNYGLTVTPDNSLIYFAMPALTSGGSLNNITVWASDGSFDYNVQVGNAPVGTALAPDGASVYVTNAADNTVSIVNTKSRTATATIPVGTEPQGVAAMQVLPVPLINQPLVPDATSPGGSGFTLTVNGTGFVSKSVVSWNGTALATTFVNGSQLTASVPASNIATATTASVTVTNPAAAPIIEKSNVVPFTVTTGTSGLTFTGSTISVGTNPGNVVVADFNGDGIPDLAVVNQNQPDPACYGSSGAGTISILLGNGDGSFSSKSTLCISNITETGTTPPLGVGDFNGDGKLDLVVSFSGLTESGQTRFGWEVFLGNGDGTFANDGFFYAGFDSLGPIIAADFNGDGKMDLAFPETSFATIGVSLGNGDGTFGLLIPATNNSLASASVVAGDFNGDGILDLASVGGTGITIFLGNGDGTFTPASTQPTVTLVNAVYVTTGDFNGDGKLDLAIADAGSTAVTVLLGNGDGTFTQVSSEPTLPQPSNYVATADLNGAGKLDLVFEENSCSGDGCTTDSIYILLGNGDGTFQSPVAQTVGNAPLALGIADFNGDGRLDIVTANSADNTVSVLLQSPVVTLNTKSLTFGNQVVGTTSASQQVSITNTGSAALAVSSITIGGTNPGDFGQTNNCTTVLPSASCNVEVTFTPAAAGSRTASLMIADNASGSPQSVSLTGVGISPVVITTTTLPNGTVGFAYNQTLQATGGTSPYVWAVTAGSLPVGLSLSSAGVISGTPTTVGTSKFTVMATDAKGYSATAPLSIVVVPSQAPTITTQPASQTINPLQTATLTVVATGAPTPTYQWYEGQSGDTSILIPGATGSSYTTPQLTTNTSYWVQVSNGVSPAANSATATVSINLTCTLTVQGSGASGSNPLSITATATCTDLPGQSFTTSIDWGDKTPPATGTGSLTASHTYAATGTYVIVATATTTSETTTTASSSVTLVQVPQVPGVFPGQTSDVPLSLGAPGGPFAVTFECTTVTDSSGAVKQASDLGISCSSIPSPVTLPVTPPPPNQPNVTITIATTGPATGSIAPGLTRGNWLVAMWLPLTALVLFGAGWRKPGLRRSGIAPWLAGSVLAILLVLITSCSGGFTAPVVTQQATPAGNYQVTVVSQPAPGQTTTGFVQTSLIVPLPVSPTP